jgi:rare lipoprotein A
VKRPAWLVHGPAPLVALLCLAAAPREAAAETGSVSAAARTRIAASPTPTPKRPSPPQKASRTETVYATWYDVPANCLARRRGGRNELVAAHNHLPLGTLVRLTNTRNGRSVSVRITDRGIHDRRARIDLCKEAAEQLDFVRDGIARVKMEVLPDDHPSATSDGGSVPGH